MIVTNVGRVAVDAGSADNERRESVRQRRVVLTPVMLGVKLGRWFSAQRRWQQSFASPGRARYKP